MDKQNIPHKITAARFVQAVRNFAACEDGWKVKWMFAGLIALLFGINGMNVVNSYVRGVHNSSCKRRGYG